jgi:hypothetical protein
MIWIRRALTGIALCASVGVAAQQPAPPPAAGAPPPAPAGQAPAPTTGRGAGAAATAAATAKLAITGDAGLVFFAVKAEGAGDFEAFFNKVKDALARGVNPEHQAMAAGWRLFKVTEGAQAGQVLYASVIDPVVLTGDYDPVKILNDVMPADAAALYPKFKDAVVSVNRANLVTAIKMAP